MQHVSRVKFNLTEFITRIIKRDRGNSEIEMIVFILRAAGSHQRVLGKFVFQKDHSGCRV